MRNSYDNDRLSRQVAAFGFSACVLLAAVGCNSGWLHELKPHRMARWNRGPAPSSSAYYSVPDPVSESRVRAPDAAGRTSTEWEQHEARVE